MMDFLDKLKFWKHHDDPFAALGSHSSLPPLQDNKFESGFTPNNGAHDNYQMKPPFGGTSHQNPLQSPFQNPSFDDAPPSYQGPSLRQPDRGVGQNLLEKEFEIISGKLDYLKASLESINQRLANLENISKMQMERRDKW